MQITKELGGLCLARQYFSQGAPLRRRISNLQSSSPALARLGLATPPPFVGRTKELAALTHALTGSPLLVVHGAVGSGKTRLAGKFAAQLELLEELQVTRVACAPGDLGVAVVARCERAMDRMPGSLAAVLHNEARLLILDDVHHLPSVDIVRLVGELIERPGVGRILLLTRDKLPLPRNDARRFSLNLEGLAEEAARDLWSHLENLYGPTTHSTCDQALAKTRGMPLAMRREYSRSRFGQDAWELECLSDASRAALEAVCIARLPAAPAAVAALLKQTDVEQDLIDLVSRQLIDPLETGRFAVHDVVRDQVLDAIGGSRRSELELRAVELVRGMGRGVGPNRPAWTAGDDGALGLLDEVDRNREVLMHLIEAKEYDQAVAQLAECARDGLARGAGGELLAQIEHLRALDVTSPLLSKVAAMVAVRHGRVADAVELGDDLDAPLRAYLRFRVGEVFAAQEELQALCASNDANERSVAAATLSGIYLECGRPACAEQLIADAFEHRASLSRSSRATLHLAFAQVELFKNNHCGARAAIARAASSVDDGELATRIEVLRVRNLVEEERFSEASKLRTRVEQAVAEVDCVPLRDELARCEALVEARVGDANVAIENLRHHVSAARLRGDEMGALRSEIELCGILVDSGAIASAAVIAHSVSTTAHRFSLHGMAARAELMSVRVAVAELRIDLAAEQLESIDISVLSFQDRALAAKLAREVAAWRGSNDAGDAQSPLEAAQLSLAAGNAAQALKHAQRAAVEVERTGHRGALGKALAIVARLELARGKRDAANAAASKAARESLACGCNTSRTDALLVLSALAREGGDVCEAATYARDARTLACSSGLPLQRLVAEQALEIISRDNEPAPQQLRSASAATASEEAISSAAAVLADLGFTASRPYRCVAACGSESFVTSASAELLGLYDRSLAVDAVRQVIVRAGQDVADLRRRSLLKRLLFLFAASPNYVFSKEEIVEKVWEVEYHPLRHDAALFTNIMRIRRLLGEDGIELIQVCEQGYSLVPPKDFLFVEDTKTDAH